MERQFTISRLLQCLIAFLAGLVFYGVFYFYPGFTRYFTWFVLLNLALYGLNKRDRNSVSWIYTISLFVIYLFISVYQVNFNSQLSSPFWEFGFLPVQEFQILLDKITFFLQPNPTEFLIIIVVSVILIYAGRPFFNGIIKKVPNYYYEFIACFLPQTGRKFNRLSTYIVQQFLLVCALAMVAFYLLGINTFFSSAVIFGFFSFIPYFGLFLGGFFMIFLLPDSSSLVFQIVGIVISVAVIWLFRFILFGEKAKLALPVLQLPVFFLVLVANFVLFGLQGLIFFSLIYIVLVLLIQSIAHAAPLLHHPNNLLRKILLT